MTDVENVEEIRQQAITLLLIEREQIQEQFASARTGGKRRITYKRGRPSKSETGQRSTSNYPDPAQSN